MLGRELVVDGDDLGLRPPADLRGQISGEGGLPHHVHTGVEIENDVARFDSVDCDLGGWDSTQRSFGHGHVCGQRLRGEQLSERSPLLVDIAVGGEG